MNSKKIRSLFAKRGSLVMIAIFAMLLMVGIEITEGLGWLTKQDWLNDFIALIQLISLVVLGAIIVAFIVIVISTLRRRNRTTIDWSNPEDQTKPHQTHENKG